MDPHDSLGFVLSTVARKSNQYFVSYFNTYDITPEQWTVLGRLAGRPGASQQELAALTEKDPNNVKSIVDLLERKRLVRRGDHPADKRSFQIFLTPEGERLAPELATRGEAFERELCAGLTADERLQLKSLLFKVNDAITNRNRGNEK